MAGRACGAYAVGQCLRRSQFGGQQGRRRCWVSWGCLCLRSLGRSGSTSEPRARLSRTLPRAPRCRRGSSLEKRCRCGGTLGFPQLVEGSSPSAVPRSGRRQGRRGGRVRAWRAASDVLGRFGRRARQLLRPRRPVRADRELRGWARAAVVPGRDGRRQAQRANDRDHRGTPASDGLRRVMRQSP